MLLAALAIACVPRRRRGFCCRRGGRPCGELRAACRSTSTLRWPRRSPTSSPSRTRARCSRTPSVSATSARRPVRPCSTPSTRPRARRAAPSTSTARSRGAASARGSRSASSSVTLGPGESKRSSRSRSMCPPSACPGDHLGGIVAENAAVSGRQRPRRPADQVPPPDDRRRRGADPREDVCGASDRRRESRRRAWLPVRLPAAREHRFADDEADAAGWRSWTRAASESPRATSSSTRFYRGRRSTTRCSCPVRRSSPANTGRTSRSRTAPHRSDIGGRPAARRRSAARCSFTITDGQYSTVFNGVKPVTAKAHAGETSSSSGSLPSSLVVVAAVGAVLLAGIAAALMLLRRRA